MKQFSKVMVLALVLGAITACAYGCVGPESDDSGVNENTDTTTTAQTTQAPTTQATTTEGALGSIAGDVSDALTDGMTTQGATTEAVTSAPARNRSMRGREGK